jgi:DNA (cytosine-5)-methyltransferase 1
MPPRVLDLFAGAGGWDVALAARSLDVLGVELDAACCVTRRAAGLATQEADVAALDPAAFAGIEGLVASPPCQAYSKGGKRKGLADPRGQLVHEPMRFVRALRPSWVCFEQVPEVLPIWEDNARQLRALGYYAWANLLSGEELGLPQSRTRAILLARVRDRGPLAWPSPTHRAFAAPAHRAVLPPAPGWAEVLGLDPAAHVLRTGMDWREDGTSQERAGARPCPTIGTKTLSQWKIVHVADAAQSARRTDVGRALSARELGLLQSFPICFPWQGTLAVQGKQIGNAIPPLMAGAAMDAVLAPAPS